MKSKLKTLVSLVFTMTFLLQASYAMQATSLPPDTSKEISKVVKELPAAEEILSVTNLISLKDSAKINEVIVFKLKSKNVNKYNTLYINGLKVDRLKTIEYNDLDSMVYFKLDRNVQKVVEKFLASKPVNNVVLPVWLSIGNEKVSILKYSKLFDIEVRPTITQGWIWVMAVIIGLLLILALKHNVLKDDNNIYYSLGRSQLLYWTILLCFAYIYLCQDNGTLPAIPSSILIILGISATTTAASKVIENDINKDNVPIVPNAKSQGFIVDILSDANSINIQRFQSVIFNLLFGIIFIQKTISTNLMPEFDDNVLLMMGISAGTYAGLKSTENKSKPIPPDPKNCANGGGNPNPAGGDGPDQ